MKGPGLKLRNGLPLNPTMTAAVPRHGKGLGGRRVARKRLHELHGSAAGAPAIAVSERKLAIE